MISDSDGLLSLIGKSQKYITVHPNRTVSLSELSLKGQICREHVLENKTDAVIG